MKEAIGFSTFQQLFIISTYTYIFIVSTFQRIQQYT